MAEPHCANGTFISSPDARCSVTAWRSFTAHTAICIRPNCWVSLRSTQPTNAPYLVDAPGPPASALHTSAYSHAHRPLSHPVSHTPRRGARRVGWVQATSHVAGYLHFLSSVSCLKALVEWSPKLNIAVSHCASKASIHPRMLAVPSRPVPQFA
jgi:hypothetical protein